MAELEWKGQPEDSTSASPSTERAPPLLFAALRAGKVERVCVGCVLRRN